MEVWVFNSDGTLYDAEKTSKEFFSISINYFARLIKRSSEEVTVLAKRLRKKHRTRSLIIAFTKEFNLSVEEVIGNTDLLVDLDRCGVPTENLELLQVLGRITAPKLVFTNSSSAFVGGVLERLGLLGCFIDIIGFDTRLGYATKPGLQAYHWLDGFIRAKFPETNKIVFCDNSLANLRSAHKLGWQTIWYSPRGRSRPEYVNKVVRNFSELLLIYEGGWHEE